MLRRGPQGVESVTEVSGTLIDLQYQGIIGKWEKLKLEPAWRKEVTGGVPVKDLPPPRLPARLSVSVSLFPGCHEWTRSVLPPSPHHDILRQFRSKPMGLGDRG